jgi:plastocyanin
MRRLALPLLALATAGALLLSACGGGTETAGSEGTSPSESSTATGGTTTTAGGQAPAGRVDPREGGFDVALGEWAVTPEARTIRPGRVTFVVSNRGTMPHGFELEREDDDSSDRDKVETRFLEPGESVRIEVDLREGVYKLECNVEGHDDMGMETLLHVRKGAPLAAAKGGRAQRDDGAIAADIEAFAFEPARIEATVGQEVTWTNHDPAEHTVTQEGRGFDSGTMAASATFTQTFDRPGEYRYICALHPGMKGAVVVRGTGS